MSASSNTLLPPEATAPTGHDLSLKEIEGPSALGTSPRRLFFLTFTIAVSEFKLRFYGSALGYFWQLLRPLLLFLTLYIVFHRLVKIGGTVEYFPAILLMNIMLFTFFGEGASATTSVVDRENLVRKIQVPRIAIPMSQTLTAVFNLGLNFLVVLIFAVLSGVVPHWGWLEVPLLLGWLTALAAGCALLLSALYVRYRDVKPMWDVLMQMLFYATPIIYILDTLKINETFKELIAMNPLAAILIQMRHAVFDPSAPTAAQSVGGGLMMLVPIGISVAVVLLGYWVFKREAPRVAEEL